MAPIEEENFVWESPEAVCEHLHRRFGGQMTRDDYPDGERTLLGVVVRFDYTDGREKKVRPVSPVPGGWSVTAMREPRPLFNLPQLLATPLDSVIYVVEGEKCVNALKAIGLVAVTSSGGANAARKTCWKDLAGRPAVMLPDNDESGKTYRQAVVELLHEVGAANVSVLELPGLGEHGDVADWIAMMRQAGYDDPDIAQRLSIMEGTDVGTNPAETGPGGTEPPRTGPVLESFANILPKEVRWLWPEWIPRGRCTVLSGAPGQGKSLLTLEIAACVTTGRPFPDGSRCERGSVILISAEDDAADTIRPRLDAAGADPTRVHQLKCVRVADAKKKGKVKERLFTLQDLPELEEALGRQPECEIVIIDPVGSHLGDVDSYRDSEVRSVLAPLTALAQKYGVAILLVAHTRKGLDGSADDLVLGSRAFVGLPRSSMHVVRDPRNPERRLLLGGKRNIAREGPGFAFRVSEPPCKVQWETGRVHETVDDILAMARSKLVKAPGPAPEQRDAAAEWLQDLLSSGPRAVKEIQKEAKEAGLGWRTVQRASNEIGIKRTKMGFAGGWGWGLRAKSAGEAC